MKFSEICTFAVIYAAYLAARRGKRSRAATAHYEVRLLENIVNLVYILKTKIYRPGVFRVFYIHPDKEYLQFCLREIRAYMDSLGLELNEKTQIFPIRNGIDFLGFHTYLTESGRVIRKLRHSSIKRMRAKLRHWEKEYPAGLVTREQILQSWQAWDAHAAHGNTWALRQQVRDRVQNILKEEI